MRPTWIDELNPAQRQAATHGGGPLLVIAGAGSGKTKTLACRVAHLIERGTAPERILLLTFTRRAAAEMIARAGRIIGAAAAGRVWGGTFHATANRLLRHHGRAVGLSPQFTVMDQADGADLMNLVRGELELEKSKRRFPRKATLIAIYSRVVNTRTKLKDVIESCFPWCRDDLEGIRAVFELYTKHKREQGVLDYDDLLLYWNALCAIPAVGEAVAGRFDHILVDEYQDTNLIQAEILRAMAAGHGNITVVGDDAQAIYSFRAATVRNILDFPTQFPAAGVPGGGVVKLEQNYRSTVPILAAANAVMAQAREGYTKNLFSHRHSQRRPEIVTCLDEADQCTQVCDRVLALREEGVALRRQAVLFRAGHHSDHLEVELTRRNVPFVKYGGLKFVEAAHVKDLVAILRILENPADRMSWYRVLQLLDGVGPASARRIVADLTARNPLAESEGAHEADPLRVLLSRPPIVPAAAREEFIALTQALADCAGGRGTDSGAAELPPAAQIERIRRFYEPVLQRLHDNPVSRVRDLEQLEQIASGYKSRGQFITDLTLDPPTVTQDLSGESLLDEDYLILSTIHSAKGCEWDAVHIIHAADGMIPSDMATGSPAEIEEERRLLYVAMTRARDVLSLYVPLRYYFRNQGSGDRHSYAQLTRFIPSPIHHHFNRVASPAVTPDDPASCAAAAGSSRAVDAMLDQLWRG